LDRTPTLPAPESSAGTARQDAKCPLLLALARVFLPVGALAYLYGSLQTLFLRFFSSGPERVYQIAGRSVELSEIWLFVVPMLLSVALVMGASAYGLIRKRPWVRLSLVAFWPLVTVITAIAPAAAGEELFLGRPVVSISGVAAITWWYVYRKKNVVAYLAEW
jgi:hypothetical protein